MASDIVFVSMALLHATFLGFFLEKGYRMMCTPFVGLNIYMAILKACSRNCKGERPPSFSWILSLLYQSM